MDSNSRYLNWCWSCKRKVSSKDCWQCQICGWYVCSVCGSCKPGCSEGEKGNNRYEGLQKSKELCRRELSTKYKLTPTIFMELKRVQTEDELREFKKRYLENLEETDSTITPLCICVGIKTLPEHGIGYIVDAKRINGNKSIIIVFPHSKLAATQRTQWKYEKLVNIVELHDEHVTSISELKKVLEMQMDLT